MSLVPSILRLLQVNRNVKNLPKFSAIFLFFFYNKHKFKDDFKNLKRQFRLLNEGKIFRLKENTSFKKQKKGERNRGKKD